LRSGAISQKHLDHINHRAVEISTSTEQEFDAQELQAVLDQSMDRLPEKCREIFYLSRFELLPNKKIAEQLQISPKTVENQITKALRILRLSVNKLVSVVLLADLF
jgi:RNA polymerase sigma-70 factor (ECF subfamily)